MKRFGLKQSPPNDLGAGHIDRPQPMGEDAMYSEDITHELNNVPSGWTVTLHNEEGPEDPYKTFDCASTFWADYADTTAGQRDTAEFDGFYLKVKAAYDRSNHEYYNADVETWGDIRRYMEKESPGVIAYPVDIHYDGSYTVDTNPHDDEPFRRRQTGVVYITREKALEEWGSKSRREVNTHGDGKKQRVTKKVREQATACMVAEIETYSQYATGDVWYYTVEGANGEPIDSCGGLYGREWAVEAAQEGVDQNLDQVTAENTADEEDDRQLCERYQ